jgi:predicted RNA polymerase sigma factor
MIRAPYVTASDAELIVWSSQGDRSAFDEIATRYGPFALRVASRLLTEREAAEDAAQEGLVRAWEQEPAGSIPNGPAFPPGSIGSWSISASTSAAR